VIAQPLLSSRSACYSSNMAMLYVVRTGAGNGAISTYCTAQALLGTAPHSKPCLPLEAWLQCFLAFGSMQRWVVGDTVYSFDLGEESPRGSRVSPQSISGLCGREKYVLPFHESYPGSLSSSMCPSYCTDCSVLTQCTPLYESLAPPVLNLRLQ
jgi:hypothetical protein